MGCEELGQIEGSGDADGQRIGELIPGAFTDSLHQGKRVIDEHINMPAFCDNRFGKTLQGFPV